MLDFNKSDFDDLLKTRQDLQAKVTRFNKSFFFNVINLDKAYDWVASLVNLVDYMNAKVFDTRLGVSNLLI